nr:uncharacterized protein LOC127314248 [Lolium perenne]
MAQEDESLYMEQNLKQIFCFGIEMTAYMSSSSSANLSWISLGSNRPLFTIFRVSAVSCQFVPSKVKHFVRSPIVDHGKSRSSPQRLFSSSRFMCRYVIWQTYGCCVCTLTDKEHTATPRVRFIICNLV